MFFWRVVFHIKKNDLKILLKYQLINIFKKANPGHGVHKVIEPTFGSEKIEFKAEI